MNTKRKTPASVPQRRRKPNRVSQHPPESYQKNNSASTGNADSDTPRVYVASPVTLYVPEERYRAILTRLSVHLTAPSCPHPPQRLGRRQWQPCRCCDIRELGGALELLPARDLFSDSKHWRAVWPHLLTRLNAIIVIPDGWCIGPGVLKEISDALALGLPIWIYDPQADRLRPIEDYTARFSTTPGLPVILTAERYSTDYSKESGKLV